MTSPLQDQPEAQRANWLVRYLGVQKAYDRQVISALQNAALDAKKAAEKWPTLEAGGKIGGATKRYQANLVRYQIRDIIKAMFKDLVPVVSAGQRAAAEAAAQASLKEDAKVLDALFPDEAMRKLWERNFTESARHSIQIMVNRVIGLSPSYTLSRRVYRAGALASGQLDRQINNHLARGASARELARSVSKSIRPDTPGGVSFAAMRLARTEINNAFHTQSIIQAEDKPWVDNLEWNLSKMHKPDPGDLCEEYANIGQFPKSQVPNKPHPQCMCYVTPVMVDFNTFAQQLQSGLYHAYYTKTYAA